jgi:hypothetical protein
MGCFQVFKTYFLFKMDALVLTGHLVGEVEPGMYVDLPREVNGPGPVPILGVEYVQFADGALPAITIAHEHIEDAPLMEFCDLEGRLLEVSPAP